MGTANEIFILNLKKRSRSFENEDQQKSVEALLKMIGFKYSLNQAKGGME